MTTPISFLGIVCLTGGLLGFNAVHPEPWFDAWWAAWADLSDWVWR